jgi:uncharacterized protein with HEPN domain
MYNRDDVLLNDIIESLDKIEIYTSGMDQSDFIKDDKTIDAVIRNIEIIGEATNKLTNEFKEKNDKIEWHRMVGMRNRLVHDYRNVNLTIIWEVIKDNLPMLKKELENLL